MKPESQELPNNPTGRPSDYTDALADAICGRIADGESLRSICKVESMPGKTTVLRWLKDPANEHFRTQYAYAREVQADELADQILDIADNGAFDSELRTKGSGEDAETYSVPNTEYMMRSKLRVDARFKLMALLAPKKYGTKLVDLTSKGDKLQGVAIVDWDGSAVQDV